MELLTSLLSNPDVLTPGGVMEIFGFFMILELLGMFFSWIGGNR